jgi:hypothetical protein
MDYYKNLKYFKPNKFGLPITMIVIGAIMLFLIVNVPVVGVLGLLILAGGIIIIVVKSKNVGSDTEYDASVASQLNGLKARALNKLGIDEAEVNEIEPISIDGYRYKGATKAKKGKDLLWRTNKYEAVMLFFSQHEVHCYTYNFTTTEDQHTEATDVYFYKDIVSVSTASESIKLFNFDIDYESFKLTTAGGTSISVSLRDVDNTQRSINAMRSLLRSKKMA